MSAAAELFHDDLNIHRTERTCGNVYACRYAEYYEACVNADDFKHLIGSLSRSHANVFVRGVIDRNCTSLVYLRIGDKL